MVSEPELKDNNSLKMMHLRMKLCPKLMAELLVQFKINHQTLRMLFVRTSKTHNLKKHSFGHLTITRLHLSYFRLLVLPTHNDCQTMIKMCRIIVLSKALILKKKKKQFLVALEIHQKQCIS